MITAAQAKNMALNNDALIEAEMGKIENRITEAAGEGKFEVLCHVPNGTIGKILERLEDYDFDAKHVPVKNGKGTDAVMIKWK